MKKLKNKKTSAIKTESKNISAKEFDSVIRQILSAPPQIKKKSVTKKERIK